MAWGLARQWYEDPDTAYGGLVLLAAIVAARQRLPKLSGFLPAGSTAGLALLAVAAAFYVAGTLAADVFLLRLSMMLCAVASAWFVLGTAWIRALLPAVVLCFVAIPLPTALVTELTLPLQLAASQCAAALLGLGGLDVVRDGNVLTLGYITLEVAEACSGMRSMVTLLALIAVYWATVGAAGWRVAILAAATVPVAILGNGLRVVATALLAARMGEAAATGPVHDATGFVTFVVMCAALAGVHALALRAPRVEVRAA